MMIRTILSTALVLGVAAGCGGDDDGGSGVDSDKPVSEATIEDAMAFCEYAQAVFSEDDLKKVSCYIEGIFAEAELGEDCQTVADQCLDEPFEPEGDDCAEIDQADLDETPACASNVTFGEYEVCVAAQADDFAALADTISCDTDPETLFNPPVPAACEQIQEECPDLFEGD